MLCIASFIVLLFLSAVSARYRKLLKKAWYCVTRRVTFRPCDTTFGEELKNSILAPLALRNPRAVKPASIAIETAAWLMVVSMVVSLYLVIVGALNLIAFGTCNRTNPEACALAAESCAIASDEPTFWESIRSGDIGEAFSNEINGLGTTIRAVPNRFRNWDTDNYLPEFASYRGGYREGLPTAIEVIDPGCAFCAQLFRNMTESGFDQTHNITYIVYPIYRHGEPNFPNSPLVAQYLTAVRVFESDGTHGNPNNPGDWAILGQIFGEHHLHQTG
ncbi:MAG: hypothetical protein LBB54_07650, partial [Cellulomonadaceae bacterium]|nr:hypothetical protein [Cellulomonadaceae bacterium]